MHQRIGVLGGTFNPIHLGHLAAAEEVRQRLNLDVVLFVPAFLPPHKHEERIPAADQRMEMVRLAIAGNDRFVLNDQEVRRGGPSYTIDTIRDLARVYSGHTLFFITGLDSFLEIRTWKQWEQLVRECPFVVMSRPGCRFAELAKLDFLQHEEPDLQALDQGTVRELRVEREGIVLLLLSILSCDISSREIRRRLQAGLSVKYLLPEVVEHYIIKHSLYA